MTRRRRDGEIHPGWRWGPFTARVPLYHTRVEWLDLWQGLIVAGATTLALVPVMMDSFGLGFEEAVTLAILHAFLVSSSAIWFGEPFAGGWITPALPLTLTFVLGRFDTAPERFQAMTAISLEFAALVAFLGITGLGRRLVAWLPPALKAGIIMGAALSALQRVFVVDYEHLIRQPVSMIGAMAVCLVFTFSEPFQRLKARYRVLSLVSKMGLLPGFLVALALGTLFGEIVFDIRWGIMVPAIGDLSAKVSPFAIGWAAPAIWLSCLPLALVAYVILFGDLVTGEEILKEARDDRPDERIDIDFSRTHLSIGLRNALMGLLGPFFPTQGVLWTGVHVIIVQRWREGREEVDSLFSSISSYYLFGLPVLFFILPVTSALQPLLPVALSLTLLLTGFACAYIAMRIPRSAAEQGTVVLLGISFAAFDPWVALMVAFAATFTLVDVGRD